MKQGCVVSPTLFNLYLNDIPDIFNTDSSDPVDINNTKLNCLVYADDLVLLSTSKNGLQHCMDRLDIYCKEWNLEINTKKTKALIFNRKGCNIKANFNIGHEEVEVVKNIKYLGLMLNNNGSFNDAISNLRDKSMKALFKLFKSLKACTPSVKTSMHLFDAMIKPILLYNSEIWGAMGHHVNERQLQGECGTTNLYFKNNQYEKMHLRWCKYILGVNGKSTNIAVLAELGRYPLRVEVLTNSIKYWLRMIGANPGSLLYDCYRENVLLLEHDKKCWLSDVVDIVKQLGINNQMLDKNGNLDCKNIVKSALKALKDIYDTEFSKDLFNDIRTNDGGNKLRTYRMFKTDMNEEYYLTYIKDRNIRRNLTKLRISAHNLEIERGRHNRNKSLKKKHRILLLLKEGVGHAQLK